MGDVYVIYLYSNTGYLLYIVYSSAIFDTIFEGARSACSIRQSMVSIFMIISLSLCINMYVYMLHISLSLSPFLSLSIVTIILSLLHSCWESRSLSYSISSLSLPPSLLHVSLCISIISSRCIRVRLVCVDSDKKRAKTFDSDKKRASSLVHVQGKSWYQSVEFLSLSLSLSPVFLSRVSL